MEKNDKMNRYNRMFKGMVDLGANTGLAPPSLARLLHLPIEPHIDGRKIGTADADGSLTIVGWITIPGYAGRIALVEGAAFILLSVIHLQQNGMGVHCPPLSTTCRLTVIEEGVEVEFMELQQEPPTNLFFVDIRLLYYDCLPLFVPQVNDYDGPEPTIYGGHAGYCSPNSKDVGEYLALQGTFKKKKPSSSVLFRVWRLHVRMNHTHLRTISLMIKMLILRNADCTWEEILLVASHQDCFACAIAKWKKLDKQIPSGITPNISGEHWSCDVNGPYKVLAIGGFKYQAIFSERSQGFISTFLLKSKDEITLCIPKLNNMCRANGHLIRSLKVDMGSVEKGQEFLETCDQVNVDRHTAGITVNPANVDHQEENMVERAIQTKNNMEGAMNVDQDLLGGSCWGLLALSATATVNDTINVHTGTSGLTPGNHMHRTEGIDLRDAFPIGYGKPVIFSRVKRAPGPRTPGQARNEFGVAVGHGRAWGSVWVLAPGRSMWSLTLRKDVREIRLKAQKQMSLEEGQ